MCTELLRALPDYWLATVTTLLAFFTLWLVIESKDAARKQLGVNTWLHFIERWDSPQMRGERKKLAQAILREESNYDSDPVLDFLEQIGYENQESLRLGVGLPFGMANRTRTHGKSGDVQEGRFTKGSTCSPRLPPHLR